MLNIQEDLQQQTKK
jgi:hypothetical protein